MLKIEHKLVLILGREDNAIGRDGVRDVVIDDAAIDLSISELFNAYLVRVIFDDGSDPFYDGCFGWVC